MQTLLFVIITFVALGVAGMLVALIASRRAPVGFEDEQGFHYGSRGTTASARESTRGLSDSSLLAHSV
jgi:hypothetical protein